MISESMSSSEIYRATPIGIALTRSLNSMLSTKHITREAALKIMVREILLLIRMQPSQHFVDSFIKLVEYVRNLGCFYKLGTNFLKRNMIPLSLLFRRISIKVCRI